VTGLEPDMNRVFAKMGQNDITRLAQNLCEIIAKDGPTEQGALYQAVFRYASYNVFQEALTSCVNAHHLSLQQVGTTMLVKPY
jgi:hypothetical protein